MATLLDAFGQFLPTASAGWPANEILTLGENLFLGRMPAEAPNLCAVVALYTSEPPGFTFGDAPVAWDTPRVQVMVRAEEEDYPTGYDLGERIRQAAGGIVGNTTIDGIHIMRCAPTGIVNYVGFDDANRPQFTVNFACMVQPA